MGAEEASAGRSQEGLEVRKGEGGVEVRGVGEEAEEASAEEERAVGLLVVEGAKAAAGWEKEAAGVEAAALAEAAKAEEASAEEERAVGLLVEGARAAAGWERVEVAVGQGAVEELAEGVPVVVAVWEMEVGTAAGGGLEAAPLG